MPVAVYGNEVWITLPQRLTYGHTYYVTVDPALFLDSTNAAFPSVSGFGGWTFSTKAAGPATPTASTGLTSITVGQDGTGDFATLQGASDWVPQNNTLPRTIHVKPGAYRDCTTFAQNRNFLRIVGDGTGRASVQLVYPYAAFSNGFTAGTLRIESSDVTVRDLTVDNLVYYAYSPTGSAATGGPVFASAINTVATTGQRIIFDNVLIKGGQDTLYTIVGITYFNGCEIWGSVDFIYGQALDVFDRCNIVEIRSTGGPVCAPNTLYAQPYGMVFLSCSFPRALVANGYPYDVSIGGTSFMRPWSTNDGAVSIINCATDVQLSTKGWSEWDGHENTCRARELGTTMIGGGTAATIAQRQAAGAYWLNTIDPDYTKPSMSATDPMLAPPTGNANRTAVTVNPVDYTFAAIFGNAYFNLNGWLPSLAPRITAQPTSQNAAVGAVVTLSVTATGTPAPTYQWYKSGAPIPGATNPTYTIASAAGTDSGSYTVVVTNSVDTVTSSVSALTVNDPEAIWANANGLDPAITGAPTADPDGDGMPNKLEFFLGGNPNRADPGILPAAHPSTGGASVFIFEFDRLKAASAAGYVVEYTTTLGVSSAWVTAAVNGQEQNGAIITVSTSPKGSTFDHIAVSIPANSAQLFARLRL